MHGHIMSSECQLIFFVSNTLTLIYIYMLPQLYLVGSIYLCVLKYLSPRMLLRVSEANEVPVSSHIWVASMTFKQI